MDPVDLLMMQWDDRWCVVPSPCLLAPCFLAPELVVKLLSTILIPICVMPSLSRFYGKPLTQQQPGPATTTARHRTQHLRSAYPASSPPRPNGMAARHHQHLHHHQQAPGSSGEAPGTAGDTKKDLHCCWAVHRAASSDNVQNGLVSTSSDDHPNSAPEPASSPTHSNGLSNGGLVRRSSSNKPAILGSWAARQYQQPELKAKEADSLAALPGPGMSSSSIAYQLAQQRGQESAQPSQAGPPSSSQAQFQELEGQWQQQQQEDAAWRGDGTQVDGDASSEDAARDAAWRWRFQRRWHTEQARVPDPQHASGEDRFEEALNYLQACGGSRNINIANCQSQSSLQAAGLLQRQGTLEHGELLLVDDSYDNRPAILRACPSDEANLQATREVASLNRRAQDALSQQIELERKADERWQVVSTCAQTEVWVGTFLDSVDVDDWGTFKFLLMKVQGKGERQKLILRGRNFSTEANIVEDLNHKVCLPWQTLLGGELWHPSSCRVYVCTVCLMCAGSMCPPVCLLLHPPCP